MSYRNDVEALQLQLSQREEELTRLRRERARVEAASRDEPALVAQLDRLRKEIHARSPQRLPVLEAVRVASPCNESWDTMVGDERSRFCVRCEKNVYNLSAMTREAAETLIAAKEGKLCVRYYVRPDGTMLTADCPVGVRRKRVKVAAAVGAVAAMATGVMAAMTARANAEAGQAQAQAMAVTSVRQRVEPPVVTTPPAPPQGVVRTGEVVPVSGSPRREYLGQMIQGDMAAPEPAPSVEMGQPGVPR